MSIRLIQQAKRFMELDQALHERGLKKKDLAFALDLYPSAYSALTNLVFKEIVAIDPDSSEGKEEIKRAFSLANNVSEKRVRREIARYINTMEKLLRETDGSPTPVVTRFTDQLIQRSPKHILKALSGVYDCYYISSLNYEVKREPFLIRQDHKRRFVVQKGNALSRSIYRGSIFLSNPYLLTIQMQETGVAHPDHFFIHIRFASSASSNLCLLKGLTVSMSKANFPISRKLILEKRNELLSPEEFNQLETEFNPETDDSYASEIVSYLYQSSSLIEYLPVPHPTFDEDDLQKELEIEEVI